MIDFIIYEESWELRTRYEMILLNYFGCRQDKFKIYDYIRYDNNTCNNKVYILGDENPDISIKIAKSIRGNGDWNSQIIIINRELIDYNDDKLLILDHLVSDDLLMENLKVTLSTASKIIDSKKSLCFKMFGEIFKIPYRDILYIEKNNNKNYCTIVTNDDFYIINDTINNLEEKLESSCFFKTHRSCIVNLENVCSYDCSSNTLYFDKHCVDLITREKRPILKNRLLESKVFNKKN